MAIVTRDLAAIAGDVVNSQRDIAINPGINEFVEVTITATGTAPQTVPPTVSILSGTGLTLTKIAEYSPGIASACLVSIYGGIATTGGAQTIRTVFGGVPGESVIVIKGHTGVNTGTPTAGPVTVANNTTAAQAATLTATPVAADVSVFVSVSRNKNSAFSLGVQGTWAVNSAGDNFFHASPSSATLRQQRTGSVLTAVDSTAGTTANSDAGFILKAASFSPTYGVGETLQHALQRVSGTTRDIQGAANVWAGTTGMATLGALNVKNGTVALGLLAVLNSLAGTTGLDEQGAAANLH